MDLYFWHLGCSRGGNILIFFTYSPLIIPTYSHHLRLALLTILNCQMDNCLVLVGLLCSSFVSINRGTNRRFPFAPLGNEQAPSVRTGNMLTSRQLDFLRTVFLANMLRSKGILWQLNELIKLINEYAMKASLVYLVFSNTTRNDPKRIEVKYVTSVFDKMLIGIFVMILLYGDTECP